MPDLKEVALPELSNDEISRWFEVRDAHIC